MSLPDDTDYICTIADLVPGGKAHVVRGPDKGEVVDPAKLGHHARGYATYNGHPVTNKDCSEHANQFAEAARRYAVERHQKYGTAQERADAAEREGRLKEPLPEDLP